MENVFLFAILPFHSNSAQPDHRNHQTLPSSSVFAPSEHRLPPVNHRKNKSRSWFKLIRAVIDNGLSYICQAAIPERTMVGMGDMQIIYTTCLLTWQPSGFDIARTEKSTAIRFSIHSIEINFPFLHDRFPGEDTRLNVRQRKRALSTRRYKSRGVCLHIECARFWKRLSPRPTVPAFRLI